MADNTSRDGEEALFNIIRNPRGPDDDQNEEDYDGSEFLNNTGEGDMIFDRDDRIDEVMNYDYDDDEELLILKQQRPARYIYISRHLVIITCFK